MSFVDSLEDGNTVAMAVPKEADWSLTLIRDERNASWFIVFRSSPSSLLKRKRSRPFAVPGFAEPELGA